MADTMDSAVEPELGTPEYDAKMADLSDTKGILNGGIPESTDNPTESVEDNKPVKPEHVPDKYFNSETGEVNFEAWSKETNYYQKKAGVTEKPEAKSEDKANDKTASEVLEDKGLNLESFTEEYTETGQLSEKTYEALANAGIPQEYVDQYITGQEAVIKQQEASIQAIAGGKEGYDGMIGWAKENLSSEEVEVFNQAAESGDINLLSTNVENLHNKYIKANGQAPIKLQQGDGTQTGRDAYNSGAEMMADMRDPRYTNDEYFRKQVELKIGRSGDKIGLTHVHK